MRSYLGLLFVAALACSRPIPADGSCPSCDDGGAGASLGRTEAGTAGPGDGGPPPPGTEAGVTLPPGVDLPGPAPLRLLNRLEYDNTIRDLLGDTSAPADGLSMDVDVGGSGFTAGFPITTSIEARQHLRSASQLAARAVARLAALLPAGCSPVPAAAVAQDECAGKFIAQFGQRAFRRPLSAPETSDLVNLYMSRRRADVGAAFPDAIRVVIAAMLASPYFLYRWELGLAEPIKDGQLVRYNPYEIASRLSYYLWASMPDDELFAAAAAGALATPAQIEHQARRLLQHPRAKDAVRDFHFQWLALTVLPLAPKDAATYPSHSPSLVQSMLAETGAFVTDLLTGPAATGKLETLLTSSSTFIDGALASLYEVPNVTGPELRAVSLDPAQRAGILTQASFLAEHGGVDDSAPIRRGDAVLRRLLCVELNEPEDIDIPQVPPPQPGQTTRERYEAIGQQPCVQACHLMFDVGFAFENYDGIGAHRAAEQGKPINASGVATIGSRSLKFSNAVDLSKQLVTMKEVHECLARQWLRYLSRRKDTPGDLASLRAAGAAFGVALDIRELMVALTTTRAFTHRSPTAGEVLP